VRTSLSLAVNPAERGPGGALGGRRLNDLARRDVEAPADGVKTVFRGHENIIKPQIARISPIRPRSQIPVQETRQLFFRTHNVTLPSPQCASAIQIVRALESTVETQPQLHPALLRLSATISQLFTVPLLTIQHRLRRGFDRKKRSQTPDACDMSAILAGGQTCPD